MSHSHDALTAPVADPTSPLFYVRSSTAGGGALEAWSTARLPYMPTGWRADLRHQLREAAVHLVAAPGQALHAVYGSSDTSMVDAENVLFYNVDSGRFAAATRGGLRFERALAVPASCPVPLAGESSHYHGYWITPRNAPFQHWVPGQTLVRRKATLAGTSVPGRAGPIWFALKRATPEVLADTPVPGRFGLRVTLTLPTKVEPSAAILLKPVFDGVISALHRHDGRDRAEVSDRLALQLQADAREIDALLRSGDGGVLGKRRLVWPWGKTVQWNPRDEDCFVGELLLTRDDAATSTRLVAEVFAIEPGGAGE